MQTARREWQRRRTTAAALKQRLAAWLAAALPRGWICQVLPSAKAGEGPAADILVISPRGGCHFLFVRAPADRWWDGGLRSVAAEKLSPGDTNLARRLRAAGHRARAVWSQQDLARALNAWGCPVRPAAAGSPDIRGACRPEAPPSRTLGRTPRPILSLSAWRGQADA